MRAKREFFYGILLLAVSLIIMSCGGDEPTKVDLNGDVVGKWYWEKVTRNGKDVQRNPIAQSQGDKDFIGCKGLHGYMMFVTDGSGSELFYDYTPTGCQTRQEQFKWTVSGKQLTEVRIQERLVNGAIVNIEAKSVLTLVSLSKTEKKLTLKLSEYFENEKKIVIDSDGDGRFDEEIWYLMRDEPIK